MGVDLYPSIVHEGNLSLEAVANKEIDEVCTEIYEACKGFGTDEERLLKAMGKLSPETRAKVAVRYPQMYEKNLKDLVAAECRKDFGVALQFLSVSPVDAECDMIVKACKGIGTKELLLGTIVCGRTNKEMELLKKRFFDRTNKDLGRYLDAELGGTMESLILNCLQASEEAYDESYHTEEKMGEDVAKLYEMGQGKFGTDSKGFFKLLVASPAEYLAKLNLVYADKHGMTLLKAMETELGGATREAGLFMLRMKLKPYEAVAELIRDACRGMGTNELLLTCTLIRYQKIMKDVMAAHEKKYAKTVEHRIKTETGGDYEKLLLEIVAAAE